MTPKPNYSLTPGGNEDGKFYVTVSLEGARIYSWFQMDIVLPEGIEPIMDEKGNPKVAIRTVEGGMYPPTKVINGYDDDDEPIYLTTYTSHNLGSSYISYADGRKAIRVGCSNETMAEFAKTSGDLFRFYVKANSYAKPQIDALHMEEVILITKDVEGYVPQQECKGIDITSNSAVTVSVSSAHHWSTLVLPFSTSIPEGVTAYTCDEYITKEESELLILKKAESFEAYTPYILYSEAGYSGTLSGTVDPANWPEDNVCKAGKLYGALATQAIGEGHFVLQNQGDGAKFYKIDSNDTFSIPAGKCYLGPDAAGTKSFGFITEDEYETSISDVTKVVSDDIYTIQGVKVNEMLPGNIYIKGGKTILKLK